MTEIIDTTNLENALDTLKSSIATLERFKNQDFADMLEDSCVKRFEYTLEIAKNLMKKVLKKIYDIKEEDLTLNNIFRNMQGYNFIKDWEKWRFYNDKRNNTAHEYNFEKSRKIIEIIPEFIIDVDYLIEKLNENLAK